MKFKGKAWKFGSDVDTDAIIPARYLNTSDPKELASHCMEDSTSPDFVKKMKPGDIIVADKNFGCGSSREHAPIAIKAAGVSCVVAKNFARIFYRNSFNTGLPIFESAEAVDGIKEGDEVEIDADRGIIRNLSTNKEFAAMPVPEFMQELISAGGLMAYTKKKAKLT
jgi:3-isopropylmalate/(R)-2-methylmalate dehydratase small subunit